MESKKASMFASLMEDDSDGPGAAHFRPPSPFRDNPSAGGVAGTAMLSPNPQQPLSCVTRATFQEDCARHRFIVWAAVKRNSNSRMKPEEKLRCPLLKCNRPFPSHESMLKHLAGCAYLATGEYLCYDHMRVERFDDLKCKRCLGHPSKRKKMLSMAKNFFHSLGNKSKKGPALDTDLEDSLQQPPPSYDSLCIPPVPAGGITELSSTEIVEIDSVEICNLPYPDLTATDGAINPQALLVPELDTTMPPADAFTQWPPASMLAPQSFPFGDEYASRNPGSKPALQVTTHGLPGRRHAAPRPTPRPSSVVSRSKGLSPSSSVRSTASTDTTASTSSNVSSLVSPASNWSGAWSMPSGVNTSLTSPVEGFNPFADPVFGSDPHDFFSELPADIPLCKAEVMGSDPLLFQPTQSVNVMYPSDPIVADDAAIVEMDEPELTEDNICCSETKSVVGSAWDALQEHLVSSMLKIQLVQGNHLADQLKPMSISTIATSGLRTLRTLLEGGQPSSAIDTLCFVHMMYAFSLAVHEDGASNRSKQFFLQSLSYAAALPLRDRPAYTELAFSIWKPADVSQEDISSYFARGPVQSPSRSSSLKGKGRDTAHEGFGQRPTDSLINAARDFLDELEMSLVMGQIPSSREVQASELYAKHLHDISGSGSVNRAFTATVSYMLSVLDADFGDAVALKDRLIGVGQRAHDGTISSVRRAEIEMLFAGKECMAPVKFFDSYTPEVRNLCDQMYSQHDDGVSRRNAYHQAGISLIERLIPEFDKSMGEPLDIPDDLDEFFEQLTEGCGSNTDLPFELDLGGSTGKTDDVDMLQTRPVFTAETPARSTNAESEAKGETPEQQAQKVEADSCCEICGYRPKGDPQWFKGSMAKHKKLQHSTEPPKIYKCPYPGCSSQYKNRADNLRQHQIEKNHWVKGDEATPRRPSKRKKVDAE